LSVSVSSRVEFIEEIAYILSGSQILKLRVLGRGELLLRCGHDAENAVVVEATSVSFGKSSAVKGFHSLLADILVDEHRLNGKLIQLRLRTDALLNR
jgi:hypothetical protein